MPHVKGISAASDYEAMVLSPEETLCVLGNLEQPEYILLLLIAATALRISEALGLRWQDLIHDKNEIRLRQTFVHGKLQVGTKTKASRASVPMHPVLGALLRAWRSETPYAAATDYIFASHKLCGRKPRIGSMIVEDYLRPAAIAAKVIRAELGKTFDKDGAEVTRFGFHSFRHSLASTLMERGEDPALIQGLLRHAKLDMTLYYSHAQKGQKMAVQGKMLQSLLPKTEAVQ
jgi:integrase